MSLSKKNILLLCASILLVSGLWLLTYLIFFQNNFDAYINKTQSTFDRHYKAISEAEDEITNLLESEETFTFSSFVEFEDVSFHIVKNNQLVFWSDNQQLILSDTSHASLGQYVFTFDENVGYIVKKSKHKLKSDSYELIFYIPIFKKYFTENKYLKSGLNTNLFGDYPVRLLDTPYTKARDIYGASGEYLFSLSNQQKSYVIDSEELLLSLFLIFLASFLFIVYFGKKKKIPSKKVWGYSYGLFFVFVVIRLVFLAFLSDNHSNIAIFDPTYFPELIVSHTLGDYLLNLLLISFFLWSLLLPSNSISLYRFINKSSLVKMSLLILTMVVVSYYFFYLFVSGLYAINSSPKLNFDITQNLEFNYFKLAYIFIFLLLSYNYFIVNHFIVNSIAAFKKNKKQFGILMGGYTLFALLFYLCFSSRFYIPLLIHLVYVFVIYSFRVNIFARNADRKLYRYFLFFNIVCSLVGAWVVFESTHEKNIDSKKLTATKVFKRNGFQGEYLLNELRKKIRDNEFVKSEMLSPLSDKNLIAKKIKKTYTADFFYDKFDIRVNVFDVQGDALYTESGKITSYDYVLKYAKNNFETEYPDLYFVSRPDQQTPYMYVLIVPIMKDNVFIGDIILELRLKKAISSSIYPRLLRDGSELPVIETSNYCVYYREKVEFSVGDIDYNSLGELFFSQLDNMRNGGIYLGEYHHLMVDMGDLNHIVVSTKSNGIKTIYANYSFLFIVWTFILLLVLIARISFDRINRVKISYSAKIQLYYNIAFFLPLVIISITILGVIDSFYSKDIEKDFKDKALQVSSYVNQQLIENDGEINQIYNLNEKIAYLANNTKTDINLYDRNGVVVNTSQPLIFESKLMSKNINPKAYVDLIEGHKSITMVNETIGELRFQVFYASILSQYDNDNVKAILSIPFFNAKEDLGSKRTALFTVVVNIFSSLFLLLLLLSYLTSNTLTEPLKLISQQMKAFSLSNKNELLKWNSDDEIGMVVKEYNHMLQKLEQSKQELEKNKKEEAWREMAKQVAHEIKNPLTPMKLSLQHMQRLLSSENEGYQKKFETLLHQIDTLSDIATSFSSFAKMPIPRADKFDVVKELNSILDLYRNTGKVELVEDIAIGEVLVLGDVKLMGRTFTNLITNAIQAVPSDRQAVLKVALVQEEGKVLISFQDNGSGIPPEIQKKVFVPNFSTKYSGSGLGLAVAKRGINHAGGEIWFESSIEGTTFFISLPVS